MLVVLTAKILTLQVIMNTAVKARKPMFRFSATSDIQLLRQVVCENPFSNGWHTVSAAMQLPIDTRRCRERTMILIEAFKGDRDN